MGNFWSLWLAFHKDNSSNMTDLLIFSWGNSCFSAAKIYKTLVGHRPVHPTFLWIWNSKCQMKYKVFFWLLLRDRLSTRDLLQRRGMELESYTCDLCILQRTETTAHRFLRCNFARSCWQLIGIQFNSTRNIAQMISKIRRHLQVPFFMDIIILMCWSIWTTRNEWTFRNVDPTREGGMRKFVEEFFLLRHRVNEDRFGLMKSWVHHFLVP